MSATPSLTQTVAELATLRSQLTAHDAKAKAESARLSNEIAARQTVLNQVEAGLDTGKIALAGQVIKVYGAYAQGGDDRAAVIRDAVQWLATGKCACYRGLDGADFGTKNYDRWHGQRSDHEWGGPSHGSIVFQVGLKDRTRQLSPEETEAAIYLLLNLERVQAADAAARAEAA